MYARSYYESEGGVSLPENYVGTAFSDTAEPKTPPSEEAPECERCSAECTETSSVGNGGVLAGLFSGIRLPFRGVLGDIKLGSEEILIIATAAFLLFSKNGDAECAIMLLLLLLIN